MHQSFSDQKTTQTTMFKLVVLSSVLALAASAPSGLLGPLGLGWGGLGLGGHLGLGIGAPLAAPLAAPLLAGHLGAPLAPLGLGHGGIAAAPAIAAYNYRGPLSLAPGQPANIVAHDGRPLDTISVNLDRVAHLTAKAVDPAGGAHIIGKRSAPLLGAAWSHTARIDLPAARLIAPAPLGLAGPIGLHGGIAPISPLGLGAWGHAGRLW